MNPSNPTLETRDDGPKQSAIEAFLEWVKLKYDDDRLCRICRELITQRPEKEFNAFYVLGQAKLRLQEPELQQLAAMNATAFASARTRRQ